MLIYTLCFLVASVVSSTSPGSSGKLAADHIPRQRGNVAGTVRGSYLSGDQVNQRNAIVRSVVEGHPGWSRMGLFQAYEPLGAAAGIPPTTYRRFCNLVSTLRRDLNIGRTWVKLSPQHVAQLEEELLWDYTQSGQKVWTKLCTIWGTANTPSLHTVSDWWYAAKRLAAPESPNPPSV